MYQLIIAEKPSVAQSIAAVLGAKRRETGYLEGGGYLVSWCFGHLAELASAETYHAADKPGRAAVSIHDDRRLQSKGKLSPKTARAIRVQSAGQNP